MYAVEIRLSDDRLLIDCMKRASEWLHFRGISAETFRYIFEPSGVVYRVDFARAAEAVSFAARFSGVAVYTAGDQPVIARRAPQMLASALQ